MKCAVDLGSGGVGDRRPNAFGVRASVPEPDGHDRSRRGESEHEGQRPGDERYRAGVMRSLRHHRPASEQVERALEASCGALMTLESMRRDPGERDLDAIGVQGHLQQAIESLRSAIVELRLARTIPVSPIALGFVAGSPDRPPPDVGVQSSPLRTA